MRALIIGGTGIISTGITRLLVERGDNVVLYNRGSHESLVEGVYETIIGNRTDFAPFEEQMAEAESVVRVFEGRTGQYIFCSNVDAYTKPAAAYPITEAAERSPSKKFSYA